MTYTRAIVRQPGVPWVLRLVYFLVFGWWATGVWINVAWFLNATIIGLPVGVWMLNQVPQVLTLRPTRHVLVAHSHGERATIRAHRLPQRFWPVRLVYFVLVGWWFSWLWANAAWLVSATIIGLPLGIWMFNRLPGITTLMRT